jgi:hypothetical protein
MNIPIVIPAYNRVECLERLLNSLNKASYKIEVKLILSIDGGGTEEVIKTADSFYWKHGDKEIIKNKVNLGLRNHILQCGRLSNQYDGIILLEDDLYVASNFYNYTITMQQFYKDTSEIAGVALYSHNYNETACLPFTAIEDGFDVFFMQMACSWGQCWLSSQWNDFDKWYQINKDVDLKIGENLPPDVRLWPDSSWKKYMIKYLVEKNKFFVYPRSSYSTNFGDAGVNHRGTKIFQVPLQYGSKNYILPKFHESFSKYDSYCEISPESIKNNNYDLVKYYFDVDIYGVKKNSISTNRYVLTTRKCNSSIKSYSRSLKPHEANVIQDIGGNEIFLARKEDVSDYLDFLTYRLSRYSDREFVQAYYYSLTPMHYYCLNGEIDKEIEKIKNSYSFKVGNSIIKPLRTIKKILNRIIKA